jgi:hypothetical protein
LGLFAIADGGDDEFKQITRPLVSVSNATKTFILKFH